jgi:hypothetical protein
MTGNRTSIASKAVLCTVAVLAMVSLWPARDAVAQSRPAVSSVLPTGGDAALLDTSDTVLLQRWPLRGLGAAGGFVAEMRAAFRFLRKAN